LRRSPTPPEYRRLDWECAGVGKLELVNAVSLGLIIAAATLLVGAITVWLMVVYRRPDRQDQVRQAVEKLVRESEGHRVLWSPLTNETPDLSYLAVQDLRKALRIARAQMPSNARGMAELMLDAMKQAAELFCDQYEDQYRPSLSARRPYDPRLLASLIAPLRAVYVPALEQLRELYGIQAGHRPTEDSSIGKVRRMGGGVVQSRRRPSRRNELEPPGRSRG
jgi:hypothetical protein